MSQKGLYVVVMAGGLGKRMKSALPKVLHPIGEIPMLVHVIYKASALSPEKILIIVGRYRDLIETTLQKYLSLDQMSQIGFVTQTEPLGTGHALQCCLPFFKDTLRKDPSAKVLIMSGDVPLLQSDTLSDFVGHFSSQIELMTQILDDPTGCGRIVTTDDGVLHIVEEKDCTKEQRKIKRVNCGIYLYDMTILAECLPFLQNDNKQKEYYLTDVPKIAQEIYHKLNYNLWDLPQTKEWELMNINDTEQLAKANQAYMRYVR